VLWRHPIEAFLLLINMIQSKETLYNGYRFRSRTEARWAVFFDAIGIKYYYEHEDFMVRNRRYLPDFYLPDLNCFVEVKGVFTEEEKLICMQLCAITKKRVIMLAGVPDFTPFEYYYYEDMERGVYIGEIKGTKRCVVFDFPKNGEVKIDNGLFYPEENRLWIGACPNEAEYFKSQVIGVSASRRARFENF